MSEPNNIAAPRAPVTSGLYVPEEPQLRKGALDFRDKPSVINGKRVPYRPAALIASSVSFFVSRNHSEYHS